MDRLSDYGVVTIYGTKFSSSWVAIITHRTDKKVMGLGSSFNEALMDAVNAAKEEGWKSS